MYEWVRTCVWLPPTSPSFSCECVLPCLDFHGILGVDRRSSWLCGMSFPDWSLLQPYTHAFAEDISLCWTEGQMCGHVFTHEGTVTHITGWFIQVFSDEDGFHGLTHERHCGRVFPSGRSIFPTICMITEIWRAAKQGKYTLCSREDT